MTREEILKKAGFPNTPVGVAAFYKKYNTPDAFFKKHGGSLSGAPHNGQPTADQFFNYGSHANDAVNVPMSNPFFAANGGTPYYGGPIRPYDMGGNTASPMNYGAFSVPMMYGGDEEQFGGALNENNNQQYPMLDSGGLGEFANGGDTSALVKIIIAAGKARKKALGGDTVTQGGNSDNYAENLRNSFQGAIKNNIERNKIEKSLESLTGMQKAYGGSSNQFNDGGYANNEYTPDKNFNSNVYDPRKLEIAGMYGQNAQNAENDFTNSFNDFSNQIFKKNGGLIKAVDGVETKPYKAPEEESPEAFNRRKDKEARDAALLNSKSGDTSLKSTGVAARVDDTDTEDTQDFDSKKAKTYRFRVNNAAGENYYKNNPNSYYKVNQRNTKKLNNLPEGYGLKSVEPSYGAGARLASNVVGLFGGKEKGAKTLNRFAPKKIKYNFGKVDGSGTTQGDTTQTNTTAPKSNLVNGMPNYLYGPGMQSPVDQPGRIDALNKTNQNILQSKQVPRENYKDPDYEDYMNNMSSSSSPSYNAPVKETYNAGYKDMPYDDGLDYMNNSQSLLPPNKQSIDPEIEAFNQSMQGAMNNSTEGVNDSLQQMRDQGIKPENKKYGMQNMIDKIMQYEVTKGGYDKNKNSAYGLTNYGYNESQLPYNKRSKDWKAPTSPEEAASLFQQEVIPQVDYFSDDALKGRGADFLYNSGRDPRVYMMDQYLRSKGQTGLPNRVGYNVDTKTADWTPELQKSLSSEWNKYNPEISKLPREEQIKLLDQGRDWYYQNTAPKDSKWDLKKQGAYPAYDKTWKGRIGNLSEFQKYGGGLKRYQGDLGGNEVDQDNPVGMEDMEDISVTAKRKSDTDTSKIGMAAPTVFNVAASAKNKIAAQSAAQNTTNVDDIVSANNSGKDLGNFTVNQDAFKPNESQYGRFYGSAPADYGTPVIRYGGNAYQEGGGPEQGQQEQIMQGVASMLQQGAQPEEVAQQLVQMGIPQEQVMQIIQAVMQQLQGGQGQPMQPAMRYGGYAMGGSSDEDDEYYEDDIDEDEIDRLQKLGYTVQRY